MRYLLVILITILCLVTVASGETYQSLNGKFHIEYPDHWEQIDYNTVDLLLQRAGAGRTMFNYEAVFAPSASSPFFSADYLILKLDVRDKLSRNQIDSVLSELNENFDQEIDNSSIDDFLNSDNAAGAAYDRQRKIAAVLSEVVQRDGSLTKNLLMMKFYDNGITSFYFYSPDSLFQQSKNDFLQIVNSFSTEPPKDTASGETVKVADLDGKLTGQDSEENEDSDTGFWTGVGVAVVLIIIVVARRKRKNS